MLSAKMMKESDKSHTSAAKEDISYSGAPRGQKTVRVIQGDSNGTAIPVRLEVSTLELF